MSSSNKSGSNKKIWVRIIAGFMAVLFVLFIFMLDLTKIKINEDTQNAVNNAAAELLADTTDYVSKSAAERAGVVINNLFTNPETFENYYTLASMQIGQGKYDKALKNIDRCLHEYKGTDQYILDDLYMKKACLQTLQGDYDSALLSFGKVSSGSAEELELLRIKTQIYIEQSKYLEAKQTLLYFLKQRPEDSQMREILAQVYYLNNEFSHSITQYTRLIKELGDDGGAWHFMRGILYQQTQDYESSIADFTKALSLGFSDEAVCYEQIALCRYMQGDHEQTISHGKLALEIGSDSLDKPKLNKYMGLAAMSLALYDDAISYFSSAIEDDENIEDVHYFRGVCYMAIADFEAAIEDFTNSIQLGYMSASCFYNRAVCYLQAGETDKAIDDLRQSIHLSDDEELSATAKELLDQLD